MGAVAYPLQAHPKAPLCSAPAPPLQGWADRRRGSKPGHTQSWVGAVRRGDGTVMLSVVVRDGSPCWRLGRLVRGCVSSWRLRPLAGGSTRACSHCWKMRSCSEPCHAARCRRWSGRASGRRGGCCGRLQTVACWPVPRMRYCRWLSPRRNRAAVPAPVGADGRRGYPGAHTGVGGRAPAAAGRLIRRHASGVETWSPPSATATQSLVCWLPLGIATRASTAPTCVAAHRPRVPCARRGRLGSRRCRAGS